MATWFLLLSQVSVLTFGLLAGVFLAFSDFIMRALANTSKDGGVEAMQVINREVFRYVFMSLFIGMAPVSLVIAGYGAFQLSGPTATLIALSGAVYLVAGFGVTLAFNVPLNEALARMDPACEQTHRFWFDTYLPRWTFWNGVRTAACFASSALLLFGLSWVSQSPSM
ncbi:MAG TPA: anthrone oxygenase family protein [Roseovarius sp.]